MSHATYILYKIIYPLREASTANLDGLTSYNHYHRPPERSSITMPTNCFNYVLQDSRAGSAEEKQDK